MGFESYICWHLVEIDGVTFETLKLCHFETCVP